MDCWLDSSCLGSKVEVLGEGFDVWFGEAATAGDGLQAVW